MLKAITIDQLQTGMFVNQVLAQSGKLRIHTKGLVKSAAAIALLRDKGILQLEIDLAQSQINGLPPDSPQVSLPLRENDTQTASLQEQNNLHEALATALTFYQQATQAHNQFAEQLCSGQPADLAGIYDLNQALLALLQQQSQQLSCLTLALATQQPGSHYLPAHGLNCAVLMVHFAQHLAVPAKQVAELSLAAMLMDVGMAALPDALRFKRAPFDPSERETMQTHVDIGLVMLEQCGQVSGLMEDVISNHHERLNGKGYPAGKNSKQLSPYAKMAAIVDSYSALISARHHQHALTPHHALQTLMQAPCLDQNLLANFAKVIGSYPPGAILLLQSDELALVRTKQANTILATVFYHSTKHLHLPAEYITLSVPCSQIKRVVLASEFSVNMHYALKQLAHLPLR